MTGHNSEETRPLSRSDVRMRRGIGIGVFFLGALLVYSLVFSQFVMPVQFQWEIGPDGERIPMAGVVCPSPWAVLVEGAALEGSVRGDLCRMPSRTLVVEGVVVGVITLAIGLWCLRWRGRPRPIHDIPWSVRRLRWDRLRDSGQ